MGPNEPPQILGRTLFKTPKAAKDKELTESEQINTLFDIMARFRRVHPEILDPSADQRRGYLCISEFTIDYKSARKVIPISIKHPDNIVGKSYFIESTFLRLMYLSDMCIWDMLIRQGLINDTVEITPQQRERIFFPVLGNENRNLLHLFSRNNLPALQEVFLKCGIEQFMDKTKK